MSCGRKATIDIDKAIRLYVDEKLSCHEVGRLVGCSGRTLLNRLCEHGVTIRHSCIPGNRSNASTVMDEARLLDLYVKQRTTAIDCARALGVSVGAVYRRLRKLGIDVRPASEGLRARDVTDEQAVTAYWGEGLSLAQTARRFHKSEAWVKKALARSGRDTRSVSEGIRQRHGTARIATAELIRLYDEEGWTCQEISRHFGKSPDFARQRFPAIGKPRRGPLRGPENPAWKGRCRTLYVRLRAHPKTQR